MSSSSGKGPIPNRWLRCPRKAYKLIADKFMAFKTPLSHDFDSQVPDEFRFPPKMLFDLCKRKKIKLGLWIDLTNTTRFYDRSEIESENCKYIKLQCRGHGETPSPEQTKTFINLAQNFIKQHPLESIGVHCTHGFNRSGFLIVSYLVEKMDCHLDIALEMFARERPPGIYKADYLEELYRRYGDVEDTPPPPSLPDWCFEEEEQDDFVDENEANCSRSYEEEGGTRKKQRRSVTVPSFMSGVFGVEAFLEQPKAFHLQKKVQRMCGWKGKGFPGSQPVSMDMKNISLLREKPYRVSWKADGTRYMMLIDGPNEVYFFDRDNNVFIVKGLKFPWRKDLQVHLKNTLLDGEMVIDKVDGNNIPRYLAYDIVKFHDFDAASLPFYPTRWQMIETEIVNARVEAMKYGLIDRSTEPFSVRRKDFWDIRQTEYLLGDRFAMKLSHDPDGLVFQPSREPYIAGRCDEVLKWKPSNMNSVDFRLKIMVDSGMGKVEKKVCSLFVGHSDQPFAVMKYTKAMKDLDGKIVECYFEGNEWKFMRERTDKSFPNSYTTAKAVCESIQNPVTKDKLLKFIHNYRFNEDDAAAMPPPAKIRRT